MAETVTEFTQLALDDVLLMALDKLAIRELTPVQQRAIPRALETRDLLVSAQTGSGKTVAFLLPLFQQLLNNPDSRSGTRALILVPTRELARQIHDQCMALGSYTQFKFGVIMGGESFQKQAMLLRKNPEIVIATPGRMVEHLERETPYLDDLEVLVLDEADRMLDMGFRDDVVRITQCCNPERQTLLFSATLGHRGIRDIASQVLIEPETLTLSTVRDAHEQIEQQLILADDYAHKCRLLQWLLTHEVFDKALVFTNTKARAETLGTTLRTAELRVAALHGDLDQKQRNQVIQRLQLGKIRVLVATDVAARGLDIPGIDRVINFDMARNGKDYVHRIGRTGRADQTGVAISLIDHSEWNVMAGIERYLGQRMQRRRIEGLEAHYKGPRKQKSSRQSSGAKKAKLHDPSDKANRKAKSRHRNQKQVGKRRAPSQVPENDTEQTSAHRPNVWGRLKRPSD